MKRGKRAKLPTVTLPPEICSDILSRLATKPLVRFQCVSKSWCSLINDPHFKSTQLINCQNNQEKTHILVMEPPDMVDGKQLCMIRRSNNFRKASAIGLDVTWYEHYQVSGYINGILCVNKYRVETQVSRVFLWNPSIRKTMELPLPDIAYIGKKAYVDFALGFDPTRNDYKVLASLYAANSGIQIPQFVEVYTLSKGTWRGIDIGKGPCLWSKGCPKASLDGFTYWVGVDHLKVTPRGKYTHLVSFDVANNVFRYIDLPDCEDVNSWEHQRFPMILGHSNIALVDVFQAHTYIWVLMDESRVTKSWMKRHSISLSLFDNFIHLKPNGDLLFGGEPQGVKSYNIENQQITLLAKSYKLTPVFTHVYIESLELLNKVQPSPICDHPIQRLIT